MELKEKLDFLKTILALKQQGFDKSDINSYFEMIETSPAVQKNAANLSAEKIDEVKKEKESDEGKVEPKTEEKDKEQKQKTVEEILNALIS